MSVLSTNELSRQQSSPIPDSAEEMVEEGKKIMAIFNQCAKTIKIYNARLNKIHERRVQIAKVINALGINNLDTRPVERHMEINVKKGKESVASEPLFLQENAIKAIFQRDNATKQASVAFKLRLTPRIKNVTIQWQIFHPLIREEPPINEAVFEFSRKSPDQAFVTPILTDRMDFDRLVDMDNFHIDIHLTVRGVKAFKDDDEGEIVSAMMEGLNFMTKNDPAVEEQMRAINEATKFLH
ncbi:Oidioi.mRNA.OKI2018_I69.chr1.g2592.t1.cds [Oikopleura dioica]|uniref:Oidioi.mRNA.OKI2018_I69.chr1.g2592.t1.cds n=1 Tax=Oikopleura dioica TaxID=34765 RepID=A0ABN7SYG5_OIKDI|nr:Oidioi.mRNA.OKI2018_I69.chr1.g2592.t1.cds [Oikopleura dioica]